MIRASEADLAEAFTEWDRRYREEPERFQSEARRLLTTTPETYGQRAAPYLMMILEEFRAARRTLRIDPIEHKNPPAGYAPCTREDGHSGPCAHPLAAE